jgi:hypothetical protein
MRPFFFGHKILNFQDYAPRGRHPNLIRIVQSIVPEIREYSVRCHPVPRAKRRRKRETFCSSSPFILPGSSAKTGTGERPLSESFRGLLNPCLSGPNLQKPPGKCRSLPYVVTKVHTFLLGARTFSHRWSTKPRKPGKTGGRKTGGAHLFSPTAHAGLPRKGVSVPGFVGVSFWIQDFPGTVARSEECWEVDLVP